MKNRIESDKQKITIGIFSEITESHLTIVDACDELKINYKIIDIFSSDWVEAILESKIKYFIYRPSNLLSYWKNMFEERIYYIEQNLRLTVYPSFNEVYYYENKKNLAYWLQTNSVPHPKTKIFYTKSEALEYAQHSEIPIVFKTNVGSASMGVKIIKNKFSLRRLIRKSFPLFHFTIGGITRWAWLKKKYNIPFPIPLLSDRQKGYIILQEYINVKWEWRIIKIGDSFFGHQKLKKGDFHSGSDLVGWVQPPLKLLTMIKDICDTHKINCMAFDIFEDNNGQYLINEMQSSFLSRFPSQMYINDVPGKYIYKDDKWIFVEGIFCLNGCNNLRVLDLVRLIGEKNEQ